MRILHSGNIIQERVRMNTLGRKLEKHQQKFKYKERMIWRVVQRLEVERNQEVIHAFVKK